jgi:diphthamide biosynthesis protein 7
MNASLQTPSSLAYVDTEYSADCIEFCPFEGYQDIFICGTYQVIEPKSIPTAEEVEEQEQDVAPKQTERTGRLLLYRIGDDEASLWAMTAV